MDDALNLMQPPELISRRTIKRSTRFTKPGTLLSTCLLSLTLALAGCVTPLDPSSASSPNSQQDSQRDSERDSEGEEPQVDSQALITGRIDDRAYRSGTLTNNLRYIVVSDASATKAAAALAVNRGSFDDPEHLPGLAHFLEHMLFLGTDEFPEPDEYQNFISQHGGRNNAYTAYDHTNYFFDIQAEQLEGALHRFSRFFVAPKLDPAYVEREKNAVHSEYQMQLKNDGWRGNAVRKQVFNPDHPASRFNIGSLETLTDYPNQPLTESLRSWYERNYSADEMSLVIVGPQSAAVLEELAHTYFTAVPDRRIGSAEREDALFAPQSLPAHLHFKPVKELRSVSFVFPLPAEDPLWRIKPGGYLANLLGHEGEGSLHALLKARGWIESLAAANGRLSAQNSLFEVHMELTPEGYQHIDEIGDALFAYIESLRSGGIDQWRYQEQASLNALNFNYQEKGAASGYARAIAANLLQYPQRYSLFGPFAMEQYDEDTITAFLNRLRPENLLLETSHPDPDQLGGDASSSRWFKVDYRLQPLSEARLARWQNPPNGLALNMPEANPFIPTELSLVDTEDADKGLQPQQVIDQSGWQHWHGLDTSFSVPRASTRLELQADSAGQSPRDVAATALYLKLVRDDLNSYSYPAHLAGLFFGLSRSEQGVLISVQGYQDKQAELLEQIITSLQTLDIDEDKLVRYRQELIRDWQNSYLERPYTQTLQESRRLIRENAYAPQQLAKAIASIDKTALLHWRQRLLSSIVVRSMSYGNLTAQQAVATLSPLVQRLIGASAKQANHPPEVLPLPQQVSLRDLAVDHQDSAISLYVQSPDRGLQARAEYGLLAFLLRPAYFNQLRTEQQLGYVVAAVPTILRMTPGITFVVQSPKVPASELQQRTAEFMKGYCENFPAQPEAEFEAAKAGLINNLTKRDDNLASRAERLWSNLVLAIDSFDQRTQLAQFVANTSKERVNSLCSEVATAVNEQALLAWSDGKFRGQAPKPTGTPVDTAAFRQAARNSQER